jgi:hypothetical protein
MPALAGFCLQLSYTLGAACAHVCGVAIALGHRLLAKASGTATKNEQNGKKKLTHLESFRNGEIKSSLRLWWALFSVPRSWF